MHDRPRADQATRIDGDAGIEAVVAADLRAVADDATGPDRDSLTEPRRRRHDGRRVHARGLDDERIEELRQAREVGVRMLADDARQRGEAFHLGSQDHGRGARRRELRLVARAGNKGDLAGPGALQGADLADRGPRIARDAPAESRGTLAVRPGPRPVISRAACLTAPWSPLPR